METAGTTGPNRLLADGSWLDACARRTRGRFCRGKSGYRGQRDRGSGGVRRTDEPGNDKISYRRSEEAFIGANSRYILGQWAANKWGTAFPYGTFIINITGCFPNFWVCLPHWRCALPGMITGGCLWPLGLSGPTRPSRRSNMKRFSWFRTVHGGKHWSIPPAA